MNSIDRRNKIIDIIKTSTSPVSGTYLAKTLNVSRQLIVGDVALLRASGLSIIATPKGYIINDNNTDNESIIKTIACKHHKDDMADELNTIVDEGATIINVIVEHSVYGEITGDLHISSRRDVKEFVGKVKSNNIHPLSDLTDGIHLHTIKCKDEETYHQVMNNLKIKNYLL